MYRSISNIHHHISIALLAVICTAPSNAQALKTVETQTGLDVAARENFSMLSGRKVGLITNHTARDRDGRSIIKLLNDAPNVDLVTLFSPEHGIEGLLDAKVADSKDELTGLHIHSLYGENRKPKAESLEGLDTLVFDIQDIGCRFYTYIATMGLCMEAAAEQDLKFVVLDRPNPITGTRVFGPFNDTTEKFTAYHLIPLVHGMTVGELAQMFKAERKLKLDLHVVRMENWERGMWYDQTSQPWINPSPNMRSITQATLYPAIGLIEACKISVGRGTDTPFERFGAPWLDGTKLAGLLNAQNLPGVRFIPFQFTPNASKFKDEQCGGVQVILIDRNAFDPLQTGLTIVRLLETQHPDDFDEQKVNNLLFGKEVLKAVLAKPTPFDYSDLWRSDLADFDQRRAGFLLYK